MTPAKQHLLEAFLRGEERALSRTLTQIESLETSGQELLAELRAHNNQNKKTTPVIGITGSPGAGKSSLLNQLISVCRNKNERVAVVAVDPSSPFTGGAILGDRIRMGRHHQDRGVFVRSMATRGALGGLARASIAVVSALEAFGFDRIFIETVGVGQSEIDIARAADHTVLVLTPAGGDAVQAFKAGIMEIADVFAINKADLPGASRVERELKAALELAPHGEDHWWQPIIQTIASTGTGATELINAIDAHRAHLGPTGIERRRIERARFEVEAAVQDAVRKLVQEREQELLTQVLRGQTTAEAVAKKLLGSA